MPYVVPSEPVLNALSGLPGFQKAGQELVIDNVPSWEECGEEYFDFLIKFIIYFHAIRNMKDSKVYLSKENTWVLKGSVIEKTPIFFVDAKFSQIARGFQKCKS